MLYQRIKSYYQKIFITRAIIASLLTIIVVLIGILFLYSRKLNSNNSPETNLSVFNSIKDGGWKNNLNFTVSYPSDWYVNSHAGGVFVLTEIADFDSKQLYPYKQLGFGNDPSQTPKEYCLASFSFSGLQRSKNISVFYRNFYTDKTKRVKCEKNLNLIKSTLDTSDFIKY